jgi:hypothetical protein
VEPTGKVSLGPLYGRVFVGGMNVEKAEQAITTFLDELISSPQVSVTSDSLPGKAQGQTHEDHNSSRPAQPHPGIKMFYIQNADVRKLTSALRELFSSDTANSARFVSDGRTKSIIARGTSADLGVIEALLLQLDQELDQEPDKE